MQCQLTENSSSSKHINEKPWHTYVDLRNGDKLCIVHCRMHRPSSISLLSNVSHRRQNSTLVSSLPEKLVT